MNGAKVYSLVAEVPFSPLDIDVGRLARGEWNALTDRFRLWYLRKEDEADGSPVCYLMVRKFDPKDGVLLYGHVVVNTRDGPTMEDSKSFTVGILSNDETRARSMLNSTLEIPPSFHKRNEIRLIERRWRSDSNVIMRFLANIHSTMSNRNPGPGGRFHVLKFQPPPELMEELRGNLGAWW